MSESSPVDLESVLVEVSALDANDLDSHLPVFEKAHASLRAALTQASQPPAS